VTHEFDLVEIVHPGPAKIGVAQHKPSGFDDVDRNSQTCGEAENRPGILGYVGLIQRDTQWLVFLAGVAAGISAKLA
jgi:hypothetical protein